MIGPSVWRGTGKLNNNLKFDNIEDEILNV